MNCSYISISTLFLLFPIIIFTYKTNPNNYEKNLLFLLLINIFLSFLFWINPTKNSLSHFYDGVFAKISYILFSIYILFVKNIEYKIKLAFLTILVLSSILFYCSNNTSKNNWCSKYHILFHIIFHFLISIGSSIAFI